MSDSRPSSETIQVGAGCVAANPPVGLSLAGYPPQRPNVGRGGLDLCARAVVFAEARASKASAALVVLDSLGVSPDIVSAIRAAAADRLDGLAPASVMVAATPGKAPSVDPGYVAQVAVASADAVEQAWSARRPTRLRVGSARAELHHNRRVVGPDGRATNVWLDLDGEHTGFTNPAVPFAVFEDAETGRVVTMVVSYGCHPVTLGPGNVRTSPDYPGYFVRALEAATGAATVVHVTGAGADINPRDGLHDGPDAAQRMGETLAGVVLDRLADAAGCAASPIRSASVDLNLHLGPDARANYSNRAADSADGRTLTSEVQAIRVGDWMLVSAPGELFAQIGVRMERAAPTPHVMVVGYANDYLGYLFTDAAFAEGGYEPSAAIAESIEQPLTTAAAAAMAAAMA